MKKITQFIRILHINFVMARHGFDRVILSTPWFYPLRFLSHLNPWNWRRSTAITHAQAIRLILEDLGPIFVKFGQILSTRRDLLPDDIADELAKLQDQVPPFDSTLARNIVEKAYGQPLTEIFQSFDLTPLASASVAQVHAATLLDGKKVVVKILRPGIEKIIRRDVDLMYTMAGLIEKFWSEGKRLHPREIVAEFEHTIFNELDLRREAANASQLRRNFINSPILYIPEVYWKYTHINILVLERIYGIPVANIPALTKQNINLKKLAETGVEIFFTQVFRDNFFHADMHPGNIFVSPNNTLKPQYIAVDFGIVGSLSPTDQHYLAENFIAFFRRDYAKIARLHVESGWVDINTRVEAFEADIRTVCEPIFEKPLKDISFGRLLLHLFQIAKRFNMEVQPQLMLLQKTLLNIEGLGKQIYPDLDLWATAKPFLEHWAKEKLGARALLKKAQERLPDWAEKFVDSPDLIYTVLQQIKLQTKPTKSKAFKLKKINIKKQKRKSFLLGIGLSLLGLAAFNLLFSQHIAINTPTINWILASLGVLALFSRLG